MCNPKERKKKKIFKSHNKETETDKIFICCAELGSMLSLTWKLMYCNTYYLIQFRRLGLTQPNLTHVASSSSAKPYTLHGSEKQNKRNDCREWLHSHGCHNCDKTNGHNTNVIFKLNSIEWIDVSWCCYDRALIRRIQYSYMCLEKRNIRKSE